MTREDMLQDLAYARTLAEEGRHAPLLGGGFLVLFGVLNLIAFTTQWGLLTGQLPTLGGAAYAYLWGGFAVAGALGVTVLRLRANKKPGLATASVRAERVVWQGASMATAAIAIGSIMRMILTEDPTAPNAIFGAAFALYGAALFATAKLTQHTWISTFAWLAALIAGVLCVFANQDWAYLIAAVGSVLVLFAPGVVLLRREPSTTV